MQVDRGSSEALFGELLGRRVALSSHDVHEILEEQGGRSHRRFGQIALAWGLCEPQHVWETWAEQLTERTPRVDLARIGVDVQATHQLAGAIAADLGIIPVRAHPGGLVIAASERTITRAAQGLARDASRQVAFVLADQPQIEQALARYYPGIPIRARSRPGCADRPCAARCLGADCARGRRPLIVPEVPASLRTAG